MAYLSVPVYPWVYTEYSQDVKKLECQLAGNRSLVNDIIENTKFTKKMQTDLLIVNYIISVNY